MSEILLYKTPNKEIKLEVLIQDETLWLSQKQIAELFGVKVPAISKHIKNIFESGELDEKVVISKMEITTQHGALIGKEQITAKLASELAVKEFEKFDKYQNNSYISDFDKFVAKLENKSE